jgi:inner membrane protein involved in colicin E2 resistance
VNIAEIKIVGAVTDENTLEEIENIAKVFAYEQRMKDYTPLLRTPYQAKKVKIVNEKKIEGSSKYTVNIQPRILVKGLC